MEAIRLGVLDDPLGRKLADRARPQLAEALHADVIDVPVTEGFTGTDNRVEALRAALRDGRCDVVVHRATNLPPTPAADLTHVTLPRSNPRDALCARRGQTLETLRRGARVGSDEPRRSAQLRSARPDVTVVETHGDALEQLARAGLGGDGADVTGSRVLDTTAEPVLREVAVPSLDRRSLDRRMDLDAVVLSQAVLEWLDRDDAITQVLEPNVIAPAPAQGALVIEARTSDLTPEAPLTSALTALDDLPTRLAVLAERTVIARLEADHQEPMGTWGRVSGNELLLGVAVSDLTGTKVVRHRTVAMLPPHWREANSEGVRGLDTRGVRGLDTRGVRGLDTRGFATHSTDGTPSVAALDEIAIRLGNRVADRITGNAVP